VEQKHTTNNDEIDLFDYIEVIIKHRRMIVRNVLVVALVVGIISFILPSTYTAETTLLPPDEAQSNSILSSLVGTPLSQFGLQTGNTTSDLFAHILKSRSVIDNVLQTKFSYKNKPERSLQDILKMKSMERARKLLTKKINISTTPEGVIRVNVEMSHPKLAADVANAFVVELDRVNQEKNTSRAKNSRVYIENQLNLTEEKLKKAADDLATFKEQYKAVSLEDQTRTAIEKAGEIKGKIIAKEVELGVIRQTMKRDNVYVIQLRREIEELNKQYNYLQVGDSLSFKDKKEFFIPFSQVPEVGLELAVLIREVKVQETVWELLNQQYYQAKIQEAKDTPTVQVLDEAVPPEFRTRPKRKLLVIIGGFLTFLISIFWAFVNEYVSKIKDEQKSKNLIVQLKNDYQRIQSTVLGLRARFLRKK